MGILSINESTELFRVDQVYSVEQSPLHRWDQTRPVLIKGIKNTHTDIINPDALRCAIIRSYREANPSCWKCEVRFYHIPWLWNLDKYIPEHVLVWPVVYVEDGYKFVSPFRIIGPDVIDKLKPIHPRGANYDNILESCYEGYRKVTSFKPFFRNFHVHSRQSAIRAYLRDAGLSLYAEIDGVRKIGG